MISNVKKWFSGKKIDYTDLLSRKALILDVRSEAEYNGGHIKTSINIPLNELNSHLHKLPKDRPIITCCASGMRSSNAKNLLIRNGFNEVYNGGGWSSLNTKIN